MGYLRSRAGVGLLLLLVLAATALVGCGGGGGGVPLTVSGYVADAGTRSAVVGAVVSAQGQTVSTGDNGIFALTNLTTNPVMLTVGATAYQGLQQSVQVIGGALNVGTLYLAPAHTSGTGEVMGTVTSSGAPAVNVRVFNETRLARTDAQGNFTLYNVPAGPRTLTATNSDQTAMAFASVNVPAEGTVSAGIIALKGGPPPPPI